MKRKLLIATHSTLATGLYNALQLLAGDHTHIATLCAYVDGMGEVETPVRTLMDSLGPDEELVVLTDVFGGSVNNEFMKYLNTGRVHLVSGVNLPLAVEVAMCLDHEDFPTALEAAIETAKGQIRYCNPLAGQRPTAETF